MGSRPGVHSRPSLRPGPFISHVLILPSISTTNHNGLIVKKWKEVFAFSESFIAGLQKRSDECGFTNYYETYATYPPKGPLPLPAGSYKGIPNYANITEKCALWDAIYSEALSLNPNFNEYRILDVWPVLWDVLGFPGSFDNQQVSFVVENSNLG